MNKLSIIILLICFAGKILNDDTALKEYKIDEKNFVVVMVAKVRNKSLIKKEAFFIFSIPLLMSLARQ